MSRDVSVVMKALPERLPEGESVLWQGQPSWRSFAIRAFHIRKVAIYFGLLLLWRISTALVGTGAATDVWSSVLWFLPVMAGGIGIVGLLAWVYCRTTTYTITDKRVVMRYGAALPITLNLPFASVGSASVALHSDGTADIPLSLNGDGRVSYLHLWPHARAWQLRNPEPMLRSVPDGQRVASLLATALQAATGSPAEARMPSQQKMPSEKASVPAAARPAAA